jgi:23S rRNA pseudoU1915 N3-methylase RlmH
MITIIALADGHGHFESAIEVYKQRLEKTVHFQLLRPISAQDVPTIVRKESLLLSDVLSRKRQHTVYLDVLGTPFSTEDFAMKLAQWQATFGDVRFVIG